MDSLKISIFAVRGGAVAREAAARPAAARVHPAQGEGEIKLIN